MYVCTNMYVYVALRSELGGATALLGQEDRYVFRYTCICMCMNIHSV
jgi:hypothetical protein